MCARVDMRGSGDSEGVYLGEYLPQEQKDACDVIEWFSAQVWCNGNVGMYGKSWSGFNGLQVAYEQPPALKAVISLYSTGKVALIIKNIKVFNLFIKLHSLLHNVLPCTDKL